MRTYGRVKQPWAWTIDVGSGSGRSQEGDRAPQRGDTEGRARKAGRTRKGAPGESTQVGTALSRPTTGADPAPPSPTRERRLTARKPRRQRSFPPSGRADLNRTHTVQLRSIASVYGRLTSVRSAEIGSDCPREVPAALSGAAIRGWPTTDLQSAAFSIARSSFTAWASSISRPVS